MRYLADGTAFANQVYMKPGLDYKTLTLAAGILVALIILAIGFSLPGASTSINAIPAGTSIIGTLSLIGKENAAVLVEIFLK
jgi:hypothetical protein